MFKKLCSAALIAVLALSLTACSSLPEGAKKPTMQISSVRFSRDDAGFDINFILQHNSLTPLAVQEIIIDVSVNGRPAAHYEESPSKLLIPSGSEISLSRNVKANLAGEVSRKSLVNPMINANGNAVVKVIFDSDEDNATFNPVATYQGIVSHAE